MFILLDTVPAMDGQTDRFPFWCQLNTNSADSRFSATVIAMYSVLCEICALH